MERVGRKPRKLQHVEKLTGSEQAKERLKWILATLSGEATIPEACRALEINESRFHQVRNEWLQAAVGSWRGNCRWRICGPNWRRSGPGNRLPKKARPA